MIKLIPFITKHWYLPVFVVLLAGYLWKKKKVEPVNKDANADAALVSEGIKDLGAQNVLKSYAAQVAEGLGTAYPKYDPRHYFENDEKVYELLSNLTLNEFKIVSKLYFQTYAKGRDLSSDLANLLDERYYSILKVK